MTRFSLRNPPQRGCWVSRQVYALNDPCVRAVEIALASGRHSAQEVSSPDTFGEGEYVRYPRDAVARAVSMRDTWRAMLPPDTEDMPLLTLNGYAVGPILTDEKELEEWAEKEWNGLPESTEEPPQPSEEEKARVREILRKAESYSDLLTLAVLEDDRVDLERMAWDMSERPEEAEDNFRALANSAEKDGVYHLHLVLTPPNRPASLAASLGGVWGPTRGYAWESTLADLYLEAFAELDAYFQEEADLLAQLATYAGAP